MEEGNFMRQKNVHILLKAVNENISYIKEKYETGMNNEIIEAYVQEKIKSSLEHLRSCLDYLAHDIFDLCVAPYQNHSNKPVYFPYGKTSNDFNTSIVRNSFGNLKAHNANVYTLLESVQPYKCSDNWLVELCESTNQFKHDDFIDQKEKTHVDIENGRARLSGNTGKVIFNNCSFNGKKINRLEFDHDKLMPNDEIEKVGLKISSWSTLHFENSDIDILKLLNDSLRNISALQQSVYAKLR